MKDKILDNIFLIPVVLGIVVLAILIAASRDDAFSRCNSYTNVYKGYKFEVVGVNTCSIYIDDQWIETNRLVWDGEKFLVTLR